MVLSAEQNIYAVLFTKLLNMFFQIAYKVASVFMLMLDSNRENFQIIVLHLIMVLS